MMQPTETISVRDRSTWKVNPEALWREINQPGSTSLPKILPLTKITPTSMHITLPREELRSEQLDNLHMRLFSLKNDLLRTAPNTDNCNWTDPRNRIKEKVGLWKFDPLKQFAHLKLGSDGPTYSQFEGYSLKYLQGTEAEFYTNISKAISLAGIADRDIIELCQAYCSPGNFRSGHFRALHPRICMPIYRQLYEIGYAIREISEG